MQRLPQNFQLFTSILSTTTNYTKLTAVRNRKWTRKPWGQTAKSKLFRVPKRPVVPPEEQVEMRRLFNNYRTYMKSIKAYLEEKYSVNSLETSDPEQMKRLFEEDFKNCMKLNDEWNQQQRVVREKQTSENLANEIELAMKQIQEHEEQKKMKLQDIEELVRQEKEKSKSFILDLEAFDAAVEHALANPVDYNFAIDLNGNRIYGREAEPSEKEAVKQ